MLKLNLIYPQHKQVIGSLYPKFQFQLNENIGKCCYRIDVSDTIDFSGTTYTFNQISQSGDSQLLLHCDNTGSATFIDSSPSGKTVFNNGAVQQFDNVFSIPGLGGYAYSSYSPPFSYLYLPDNADFNIDGVSFTIEGRGRITQNNVGGTPTIALTKGTNPGTGWSGYQLRYRATYLDFEFLLFQNGILRTHLVAPVGYEYSCLNMWREFAIVGDNDRTNRPIALFIDGKKIAEAAGNYACYSTAVLGINIDTQNYRSVFTDELKFTNGVAKYKEDFIPVPIPFENSALTIGDNSIWSEPYFNSIDLSYFIPPDSQPIPNGKWYYKVSAYTAPYSDIILAESQTYEFTIEGGTQKWRIGTAGSQIDFKPSKSTVTDEIVRYGRRQIIKKKFTIDFAHMNEEKRTALYNEFNKNRALILTDNLGNDYYVYWGEVERTLGATAHQPIRPVFGIDRSNMISGALRWSGSSVFSEV